MTEQIAIHCLKSEIMLENCEECPVYGETGTDHCQEDAIRLAIAALEKQIALKNVIEQIEELKAAFEAGTYQEEYCLKQMLNGKCKRRDCSACVLERAIEIIKQELCSNEHIVGGRK